MNSTSHILFGVTLAGLATVDPSITGHLHWAVAVGTILGSNAPDIDTVMKLKGKDTYKKFHRGITHSLPAPFIWALVLGIPTAFLFGVSPYLWTIVGWTFAAVCFHILLDLLNPDGVKCLWPFSNHRWHLDALNLFDPLLFGIHLAAALCWLMGWIPPAPLFLTTYGFTVLYLTGKVVQHHSITPVT